MILATNNKPIAFLFFIGYKNTTFEMMNSKIYDVKIVKERIRHYCAVMDRCQYQVITKLKSYGVSCGQTPWILVMAVFGTTMFHYNVHYPNLYAFGQEITEPKNYAKLNAYIEIQGQSTSIFAV